MTPEGDEDEGYYRFFISLAEGRANDFGASVQVSRRDTGEVVRRFRGRGVSAVAARKNGRDQALRWIGDAPCPEGWQPG